jgi:hypothetical protein
MKDYTDLPARNGYNITSSLRFFVFPPNDDKYKRLQMSLSPSTVPEKGILTIDVPGIHPIVAEWDNSDFIHSYKPEEFKSRITNVHDKESTTVYDVLRTFREGSNIAKTPENQISIAQLLDKKNRDKIIEQLFKQLRNVFRAPEELSLPYTTNTRKRCAALVERISKLYDVFL